MQLQMINQIMGNYGLLKEEKKRPHSCFRDLFTAEALEKAKQLESRFDFVCRTEI